MQLNSDTRLVAMPGQSESFGSMRELSVEETEEVGGNGLIGGIVGAVVGGVAGYVGGRVIGLSRVEAGALAVVAAEGGALIGALLPV